MKRALGIVALVAIIRIVVAGCLNGWLAGPQSVDVAVGWDHAAFVEYLRDVFKPTEELLEKTGDALDFERFRFFSGKDLNGEDETVVHIPLTLDSPSHQKALLPEELMPLASIAPLPLCGFLSLDPSTCFHSVKNGVPYVYRIVDYERAELVGAKGEFVRWSTTFSWGQRGNPNEPEWYKYQGNSFAHFISCCKISTNQG